MSNASSPYSKRRPLEPKIYILQTREAITTSSPPHQKQLVTIFDRFSILTWALTPGRLISQDISVNLL